MLITDGRQAWVALVCHKRPVYVAAWHGRSSVLASHVGGRGADVGQSRVAALDREVPERDDAEHTIACVDDGKPSDGLVTHEAHRLPNAGRRGDRGELAATDAPRRGGVWVCSHGEDAHDDVAVGQNADEPVVL